MEHTIILLQPTNNKSTRTFLDYDTVPAAMDGIINLFENRLKESNKGLMNITYEIHDLYEYIEGLADLSALVFDATKVAYVPCSKDWIKKRVFSHLRKQANGR